MARQCEESTRALVASAATVMTPRQRARYLELPGPRPHGWDRAARNKRGPGPPRAVQIPSATRPISGP